MSSAPPRQAWSRLEVEAIVEDYFRMLELYLAGIPFKKSSHREALLQKLPGRTRGSVEMKHQNISAVLTNAHFQYLPGYLPAFNYQQLLEDVVLDRLPEKRQLLKLAEESADATTVLPEVADVLKILTPPPKPRDRRVRQPEAVEARRAPPLTTNYVEREARNRSLGLAGEQLVLRYEQARLIHEGQERLAAKIEHTSVERGDHEGYDILSFEADGRERLIEVKTTKYGIATDFFVSRNEVHTSALKPQHYQVYRLYDFRTAAKLYQLPGAIDQTCHLAATTFLATPRGAGA